MRLAYIIISAANDSIQRRSVNTVTRLESRDDRRNVLRSLASFACFTSSLQLLGSFSLG